MANVLDGTRGPGKASGGASASPELKTLAAVKALLQVGASVREAHKRRGKEVKVDPNEKVYQSRYARYMVLLEAPQDTYDPLTGRRETKKGIHVKFEQGVLRTSDKPLQAKLERNKHFGIGGDFWLLEDGVRDAVAKAASELVAVLASAPPVVREEVSRVLADQGDEFVLPVPPEPKKAEIQSGDAGEKKNKKEE